MPPLTQARLNKIKKLRVQHRKMKPRIRMIGFKSKTDSIIYQYRQYCDSGTLTYAGGNSQAVGVSAQAWQFTLAMLPQAATFTALYDVYRIRSIEFTIRPRAQIDVNLGSTQGTLGTANYNTIIVAVDHDDSNVPATYNSLREYGDAKEINLSSGRAHKFFIKPAVAAIVYNNGITTGNSERFSPWIDCANTAIPHYGIKVVMSNTAVDNQITYDVTARYLVDFKQVR